MKRPLSSRLRTNAGWYLGYGDQAWFLVNGKHIVGITNLIEHVLERFARRFGRVSIQQAWHLHKRLAYSYSANPGQTFSALCRRNEKDTRRTTTAYPKEQASREWLESFEIDIQVERAIAEAKKEKRQFIPSEKFEKERSKKLRTSQRWYAAMRKHDNDLNNLKECKKLIRKIKETLNENA